MLLEDERKSRLFKVENQPDGTIRLTPMKYLSDDHSSIEVYPHCNLIVSFRSIYTLDEQIVVSRLGADVKLYCFGEVHLIVLDYHRDSDTRYCVIWWNGEKKYEFAFGYKLVITDRYLALYIKRDKYWTVYTIRGTLVLEQECLDSQDIEICGDFLMLHSIGNHSVYGLKQQYEYTLQSEPIFSRQQLILCSKRDEFAIGCDLSGAIRTYYRGNVMQFERADRIEILDFASLFCLKRGNKFFLYRFDGTPFATELCPDGADFVGADTKDESVLLGVDDIYREIRDFT